MSRRKGSDNFGFRQFNANKGVRSVPDVSGAEKPSELGRPQPFHRRFRPAVGTKDFSVLSDYNYASLWSRWRRGYELAMYSQQAYDGLTYSFKYYVSGAPGLGIYLPGIAFMYPTTRSDMKMWMVGVRPRDSFNFRDFGYSVQSVSDYDEDTYAVVLSARFGAPISFFTGEVLSNRFDSSGTEKKFGFNNYTVTAVGFNGTPLNPSYAPIFNTLFLSKAQDKSWSVVDANTLAVPASGPPGVGEFLTTEMRAQCTCPDFLGREGFDLYSQSLKRRYPYTGVFNMVPGEYDAGPDQTPRVSDSIDNPGYARDFGFIYLNEIYNIPSYTQQVYSDPNLFYYQPRWCKHIYASMWDLEKRFNQDAMASPWLPQPNDEPMNEWYREKFEVDLKKQVSFYKRERDLIWWQRYSPAQNDMPTHMMYPDMYNMMSKTLNAGTLDSFATLQAGNFEMSTVAEFDPFAPVDYGNLNSYDGGTYANGDPVVTPTNTLDGGTYANGDLVPALATPINGGVYD